MHKTAMERPYKALFIDIDNTLLTFRPSAERAFRKTFEAMGITYEPSYYEVYYWSRRCYFGRSSSASK